MARFFASTIAAPDECEDGDCRGNGEQWLRQLDIATLRTAGHHEGVRYALLRNGKEGHPIDTETPSAGTVAFPDQFLFLNDSGHTLRSEAHEAYWHHWIRYSFGLSETLTMALPTVESMASKHAIRAQIDGSAQLISSADLVYRASTVHEFGPLDGLQGHSTERTWIRVPAIVQGGEVRASIPAIENADIAYFFEARFDDGSGEGTIVTSPVLVQ